MKAFAVCFLSILTPATTLGAAPESILGTWQFDVVRTVREFLEQRPSSGSHPNSPATKSRPEIVDLEQIAQTEASIARNYAADSSEQHTRSSEAVNRQAIVVFTADTMTAINSESGTVSVPYKLIGGNVGLVVVQVTDDKGYESVLNIWLVESGIAVETTDCQTYPEQCVRERQRAKEIMKRKASQFADAIDPVLDAHVVVAPPSQGQELGGRAYSSQPRRVYFTRVPEKVADSADVLD